MLEIKPKYIYKNGNHETIICENGTKIKRTFDPKANYFIYDYAENADIKITDYCTVGCPYCHEGSNKNGKHADLKSLKPLFETLHPGTELAIGGGNALEHPDIDWFLELLYKKHILANITVNQKSLSRKEVDRIKEWQRKGWVNGIGVSLVDYKTFDSELIDELGDNVVIHIIVGTSSYFDLRPFKNRKVLILGYKNLRRGHEYLSQPWMSGPGNMDNYVKKNRDLLIKRLPALRDTAKVVSFDDLAIDQLHPQQVLDISDKDFNFMYQGSDTDVKDEKGNITCATFYIDAVNKTCARMSTAALDKRFPIGDNDTIDDLFRKSIQDW